MSSRPTPPTIPLDDVVHCRAGDKGDDSLLVVAPYDPQDFDTLRQVLTVRAVARHFAAESPGRVSVTAWPALHAVVVVVRDRLHGGVTRSTGADPHGKTLSSHLLSMQVPWPDAATDEADDCRADV